MIDSVPSSIATGRTNSFFETDMVEKAEQLIIEIRGKRVLMIGAAGSIGASTVFQVARRGPAALHVVDQNENGLAELTRQLRASPVPLALHDFQALPLNYGSASMRHFLLSQKPYDAVLNFAALKHVRTEKDPYSTLQMLETNLLMLSRLMETLKQTEFSGRLFCVSTDKAANPASLMGASKRVMEHVLYNSSESHELNAIKTSTRFANVAFSNGSLPQSYYFRLQRGEPLVAPENTKRYFVTMKEAGEICLLAAFLAPTHATVVPKLSPDKHLVLLQSLAERFLQHSGYQPALYSDQQLAIESVAAERKRGAWPLLVTPRDTAGEKPFEEFVATGEALQDVGLQTLNAVEYLPRPQADVDYALRQLEVLTEKLATTKGLELSQLKALIGRVEPAFMVTHSSSQKSLDQRL